jgi:hypothetical protein
MPAKSNAFSFRVSLRALSAFVQVIQGAFECSLPHLRRVLMRFRALGPSISGTTIQDCPATD